MSGCMYYGWMYNVCTRISGPYGPQILALAEGWLASLRPLNFIFIFSSLGQKNVVFVEICFGLSRNILVLVKILFGLG